MVPPGIGGFIEEIRTRIREVSGTGVPDAGRSATRQGLPPLRGRTGEPSRFLCIAGKRTDGSEFRKPRKCAINAASGASKRLKFISPFSSQLLARLATTGSNWPARGPSRFAFAELQEPTDSDQHGIGNQPIKPAYAIKLAALFNLSWSNRPLHNAPDLARTLEE